MADNEQKTNERTAFSLQKVFVKDVSFESPMSPHIFTQQAAPEIDIQLQIRHNPLVADQGVYEVVLSITVTAKLDEDKVAFLCEVQQGGVFVIQGVADEDRGMVLEIACPNILLPFVRETVADLVAKGGFPQLLLNPVNFEALFQQKRQAAAQSAEAGTATTPEPQPPAEQ